MTTKYNEHSENFAKSWIFDNDYDLDSDVKVRDHFISVRNIEVLRIEVLIFNIKLNYKVPVIFYNLNKINSYLNMLEIVKFNLKTNAILNGSIWKYMSFRFNKHLRFIDSFQ